MTQRPKRCNWEDMTPAGRAAVIIGMELFGILCLFLLLASMGF